MKLRSFDAGNNVAFVGSMETTGKQEASLTAGVIHHCTATPKPLLHPPPSQLSADLVILVSTSTIFADSLLSLLLLS